ncbi:FUN31 [[Candida] subhashii]|uniref:non-specific serine/threonine protein kinase n=1 Tax=[Candida] subhashii TaxID=561895 RepID=A0A8J5QJ95_9ASCO|nr:FUN31 [[Candida] subhashii]KAG7665736.1 FUN31 [[Candida] subhashii]
MMGEDIHRSNTRLSSSASSAATTTTTATSTKSAENTTNSKSLYSSTSHKTMHASNAIPHFSTNNANLSSPKGNPSFYIFEDEDSKPHVQQPKPTFISSSSSPRPTIPPINNPLLNARSRNLERPSSLFAPSPVPHLPKSITPASNQNNSSTDIDDILKFPVESSHAYSYAHLSPNSLALRLNVLKRSLEILKDRPDLFRSIAPQEEDDTEEEQEDIDMADDVESIDSSKQTIFKTVSNPLYSTDVNHSNSSVNLVENKLIPPRRASAFSIKTDSEFVHESNSNKKYKIQPNASSAALAAFFRPPMKRSGSLPLVQEPSSPRMSTPSNHRAINRKKSGDRSPNGDLQEIVNLLEKDLNVLMTNTEVASSLHDLSFSPNDESVRLKHDFLKKRLLYALAMPFMETTVGTSSLLQSGEVADDNNNLASSRIRPSTTALNLLNNNYTTMGQVPSSINTTGNNRPFHSMLAGKHSLPQSVFTVETDFPWSVIAANDLACLMFGVSKNSIKSLTFMDLIAPQFRDFVMARITKYLEGNLDLSSRRRKKRNSTIDNNILFAGEIVAIVRPGDQNFAWTSLWAKRKGNLIILMFDQIPCDAFDVVISCERDEYGDYHIDSMVPVAGKLAHDCDIGRFNNLSQLSESLNKELNKHVNNNSGEDHDDERDVEDSEIINQTRYYTLQLANENIPCAITSNPLEIHENRSELKLKIHTMPYIAGIFVISSSDYKILSCNNAIARNLFGKSIDNLYDHAFDELIPNFTKILNIGLETNVDTFELVPGLVLPEHFFRKYDAVLRKSQSSELEDEEQLFFNSNGIEGIHRDGKSLFVDVQLRASSHDTLVVWVTYSRSYKNRHMVRELDKLSSSTSSISLTSSGASMSSKPHTRASSLKSMEKKIHERSVTNLARLPSQLKLFQAETEQLEFLPKEITTGSSVRKAKRDSFGIPVSRIDSFLATTTTTQEHRRKPSSPLVLSTPVMQEHALPVDQMSGAATIVETKVSSVTTTTRYKKFSEEELLKLENQAIEQKMNQSTRWPREVGLARRTKKFTEFTVVKDMGEGAYGKVVLARHKEDPVYTIIIKCIDKERILVDTWVRDRRLGTIPSEIQIMAYLNSEPHPNIMRIIDFFEDSKYYYLETPIFGNPPAIDLFDFIEIKKDISEFECQLIFKQIVAAIYHLHKNGIVHRDIKDENIIVDENGIIKLIDFGSAGYVKQGPFDVFVGTIDYASPEVLRGEKYEGRPQDIWALGILLYTMLYKENPFYNVDEIMEGDLRIPYVISEASLALIRKILNRNIEKRPTITDIVEDEWLML